ncbi:amidohydrolase/deacetylase family metallohydrolase [Vineibacter terrae]|uniref:amidohydrolase/deacetylase family metallohydrolase n=1 Tax=Vineibacter terrae TaxID=2586908 RepID=UPI002E318917|nr:amidohydrolase/deacetylase family metallohydrolase [Vineibacter terrae]HEX2889065.1 amidohydrolase/deacetylase family metallohydrolase [Vineibacter terrae]
MDDVTRRTLLHGAGTSLAAAGFIQEAMARVAAFGPDDPYDLVVRGGEVIDPSQNLRGRRDIGIRNATIAAVEREIPPQRGTQTLDAAGQLVLPGLIDFHAHVLHGGGIGLSGDELVPYTGTTTYVSAGDAGVGSFSAFKHAVIAQSRTRILAFLHISSIGLSGFPVGEMLNIDHARVDAAAKMLAENPDVLLGMKVRETLDVVGQNGLEPLKRAIAAAERSGVEGARVMCHIGNAPGDLSALLDLLRPGDVLTHSYSGAGNNTVVNGRVLDAALAAKRRGVLIDVGHGGGSFDYTVCEAALQQGFTPDIISSDVHAVSVNTPGKPFLPWVMSKFLNLGVPLEHVVAMATINPATAIGRVPRLGTLQVGAPADLSIVEMVEGPVDFVDTRQNQRKGERYIKPVQTVKAGRPFGRPYPQPFAWP